MLRLAAFALATAGLFAAGPSPARAETCSVRAAACRAACTPALVSSGQQYGGTVAGCLASCRERRRTCLATGTWVHMGSQRRGLREQVGRR